MSTLIFDNWYISKSKIGIEELKNRIMTKNVLS